MPAIENLQSIGSLDVRVVIFTLRNSRLQVLLTNSTPAELPGRPVGAAEGLEAAAGRCLQETIGHCEAYLEQLYTYGDPGRCGPKRWISVVYFALIPAGNGQPAANALWAPVDAPPILKCDHTDIVTYALRRLRYKLEYSAVGFELLPENFTLSELQRVYELVLGETLDKRNFRRRILEAGIIESTPNRRAGEGRPAQLYRYRPDAVAEVKARRLFP